MDNTKTFADAISNQEERTENGMKAVNSTSNACTDLFFKIGASRGKDIIPDFVKAYVENPDHALRIALWARDIREGAGERKLFKDILTYLDRTDKFNAKNMISRVEELGRWDDLLIDYTNKSNENYAFSCIAKALAEKNGLCAKWMPRKGPFAIKLRKFLGFTPKQYRKTLVGLTNVVETAMCKKDWNGIDFSKVPSVAATRYKTAFYRNAEGKFTEYVEKLSSGDKSVKVNAGAVYPYDIIKGLCNYGYHTRSMSATEEGHIIAQWDALPNFVGDASIFPMVDSSGSMDCAVGGSKSVTCIDVAVSLGLYLADKNQGVFKDCFLTFSEKPVIEKLGGNIVEKVHQMSSANWGMDTNLHAAFDKMLSMANGNGVPESEMPKILLILSDMQFNQCIEFDNSAFEMINKKYKNAGYKLPKIVFWNLRACDNVPVKFDTQGTALISGFSPSIMKSVLSADMSNFTPEAIMLETIMNERYKY